jgi:hypothetical protein
MTKLTTADHVSAILAVLSADTWLLDLAWQHDRTIKELKQVTLPNRASRTSGGFLMIEVAPKDYVETDNLLWPSREAWEADRVGGKRYKAPFAKHWFKRNSKSHVDDEIKRSFSTVYIGMEAETYEKDRRITRIEFRLSGYFGSAERADKVVRVVQAADIPGNVDARMSE